jgi:hypothetical protein
MRKALAVSLNTKPHRSGMFSIASSIRKFFMKPTIWIGVERICHCDGVGA